MMKKLITLALIIGTTTFIEAQSNLVFNQAIILELGAGATVPEGKIWKVTYGTSGYIFDVNGQPWSIGGAGSHKATPLWFPEGSVFTRNTGSSRLEFLNILEFNVVPISSSGDSTSNGPLPGDDYTPGDGFSDTDGNTYETVEINGQTWTTTNLNISTYRDGTPIPYISDFTEWSNAKTGAYTYAGQDSGAGYGKLYNVFALAGIHDNDGATPNKILAPEGYHIPSLLEWKALIDFYIGSSGTPFNFTRDTGTEQNSWHADAASTFFKSQTSWNNNGTNESGLNIKNYPNIISGGSWASNFSSINEFGFTRFATNQIHNFYDNYELVFKGVMFGEFYLDSCELTGIIGNNSGVYIRLVKD